MDTPAAGRTLDVTSDEAERVPVTFEVNGETRRFEVQPWTSLLDLLREHCHLTGTKKGCDHGQCGACTAIVDGQRINTCLALAVVRDGASITTIEGLAEGDTLHYVTREGEHKQAPFDSIDRAFSEQLNRDRHVAFQMPR